MKERVFWKAPLMVFAGRFLVCYLLLSLPWPGMTGLYRSLAGETASWLFDTERHSYSVSFAWGETPSRPYNARITIVNPKILNADGSGPVRHLDFDARCLFSGPYLLLVSLIVASPVPWRRRWRTLMLGLPVLALLLISFFEFCLWQESSEIGLVVLSPAQKEIVSLIRSVLTAYQGFLAPIFLWLVITFQSEDVEKLLPSVNAKRQDGVSRKSVRPRGTCGRDS